MLPPSQWKLLGISLLFTICLQESSLFVTRHHKNNDNNNGSDTVNNKCHNMKASGVQPFSVLLQFIDNHMTISANFTRKNYHFHHFYIHPKYNYFSTTSLTLLYNQLTALVTKLVMWLRCTKMLSTKLNETAKYTYTIWYANGVRT